MRFGEFEGVAIKGVDADLEIVSRYHHVNARMALDPHVRFPGSDGETPHEVAIRSQAALAELFEEHGSDKHIAVVSHGRTNSILLSCLLQGDASKFGTYKQGNTAINVLDWDDATQTWTCVLLNYDEHIHHHPSPEVLKA
jgi:broad specificity phosphatase PhoE